MSYPRTVGPFTVTTVTVASSNWPIPGPWWRGGFYVHGKHFIVHGDDTGVVYRFSSDEGVSWSAPVTVRTPLVADNNPVYIDVHFDGTYLHYALIGLYNQPMRYRRGLINPDGSITWSAAEQIAIPADPAYRHDWQSITTDSEGCPVISYQRYGVPSKFAYITKSSNNDGTWSTEAGYPRQLSTFSSNQWSTEVISLGSKRLCVFYGTYNALVGYEFYTQVFDGSSWGAEEGPMTPGSHRRHSITRGPNSSVLLSYTRNKDTQFRVRPWGGPWGAEVKVLDQSSGSFNVIATGPDGSIYILQFTNYGSYVDYVIYAVSTDGGTTWTNKAGGAPPEIWIDETTDDATQGWTFSSSYHTWDGVLSFVYITKESNPRNVRYAALRFWETTNLPAKFEVGQGSVDLKAGFLVAQDSSELFAELIIRQKATVDLSGEFTVRHEGIPVEVLGKALVRHLGSAELLGKFDVGQDSAELLGKFEAQSTAELLAKAEIQQSGSVELLGKGIIRQSGSADLLGNADVQQSGSVELLGKGIIRQSGSADLLGNADVQQSGSAELLGRAEVQQSGSAELLGKFEAQVTAELLGKIEVQQSGSAELLGKAEVQQSGSAEILGNVEIRQSGSAELLGRAEVTQPDSAELLSRAVIRHVGTPVELLGRAIIRQSGFTELLGKTIVKNASSAELLGRAVIRHVGTPVELLGKAKVQQSGSAEFLSKADIRQSGSAELLGRAEVRQSDSAELLGEFIVRHEASANLLGEFIARHEASRDLLGEFISKNVGSADFLGELVVRHPSSQDLLGELIARHLASLDLLGEFIVRQVTSEDLLGELVVRHEASVDLHAAFESQASVDLLGEFTVRQIATINLLGKFIVKHPAELDLPAKLQVTHSERLLSKLWIRHPYRLWTNRRYVNGVVELDETELSDALLEYVIQGVMDDIKSLLINEALLAYVLWTDITVTPKLIRRAATYGTVASLYSRNINDPNRRIVLGLRTIRLRAAEVRSAQERAMDYWETRMEKMMDLYLTSGSRRLIIVDTEDEEPVFSLEDIPFYSEDPYKIEVRPS